MRFEFFARKQFTAGVINGVVRIWLGVINLTWPVREHQTGKQYVIFWCGDHLSISLGGFAASWTAADPWWWNIRIAPLDILLGRGVETRMLEHVEDLMIPMVEGSYPAKAVAWTYTTKRPRWRARKQAFTEIDVAPGIPVPTPWGEDVQSGVQVPGDTSNALAYFILYVLNMRKKHGGSYDWRPRNAAVITPYEPDAPTRRGTPKGYR